MEQGAGLDKPRRAWPDRSECARSLGIFQGVTVTSNCNTLHRSVVRHTLRVVSIRLSRKLAESEEFSSNSELFATLADWEHQLQHLERNRPESAGDEFGGPEL